MAREVEILLQCSGCNAECPDGDLTSSPNDGLLCEDCQFTCSHCDQIGSTFNSSETHDGDTICGNCRVRAFFECLDCDLVVISNEAVSYGGYHSLCPTCYEHNYFTCDSCNEVRNNDDYASDGRCDRCYEPCGCQSCRAERGESSDHVLSYSTNVLDYHQPDNAFRLFGVELEVATRGDVNAAAESVYDLMGSDCILKSDSSISENDDDYEGFEIVTRPMTLANQFALWNRFLDGVPSDLRSYDVESCGLHIHVTRASISHMTIGKLLVFLNDDRNETLIRKIAQRYSNGYSQKKFNTKISDGLPHKTRNESRYSFLNCTNEKTIEFRIFRGTLNRTRLIACLEFTAELISFAEKTRPCDLSAENFLNHVGRRPKLESLKSIFGLNGERDGGGTFKPAPPFPPAIENPFTRRAV